jgi:hypothetical protein
MYLETVLTANNYRVVKWLSVETWRNQGFYWQTDNFFVQNSIDGES